MNITDSRECIKYINNHLKMFENASDEIKYRYIEKAYTVAQSLSLKPSKEFKCYSDDAIIDESKSKKWNKTKVKEYNDKYNEEVERLTKIKNETFDYIDEKFIEYIIIEFQEHNIRDAERKATVIIEKAKANVDKYDYHEFIDRVVYSINLIIHVE